LAVGGDADWQRTAIERSALALSGRFVGVGDLRQHAGGGTGAGGYNKPTAAAATTSAARRIHHRPSHR